MVYRRFVLKSLRMRMKNLVLNITILTLLVILSACASTTPESDVLTPVSDALTEPPVAPVRSAAYEKLAQVLSGLGCSGVGLEFEDDITLERISTALSHPKIAGRKLQLLYTGMSMSYDATPGSLTIGGVTDSESIVRYIIKHVPLK